MKLHFGCYVIQIGKNREVLYVNYGLNEKKGLTDFMRKHRRLRGSKLRPELYSQLPVYISSRQAQRAAVELVRELELRGYEVIAGGPLMQNYWQTYVIEIDGDPRHVYVGETNYPREKRLQQHIYHFNSSRALRRYDVFYLSDLCDEERYWNKPDSKRAEEELATRLKGLGYRVEGGT